MKSLKSYLVIFPLAFLFCLMLYKNISYPLLWNDETETVMTATHILKYGYPKMQGEKNIIFLPDGSDWIGYKASSDANISMPWGHYYFTTIGVFLADQVSDLYTKGGIIRSISATFGLAGILILILSFKDFFSAKNNYLKFIAAFIFIELFSVSLFLHMREARYYSLVIFVVSLFFYVFIHYFILNKISRKAYLILMTLSLFICYHVNVVTFLTCCLVMVVYDGLNFLIEIKEHVGNIKKNFLYLKKTFQHKILNLLPVLICGALITPFVIYLETFSTASRAAVRYGYDFTMFVEHLKRIYYVFSTQEFLYLAFFVKLFQVIIWYKKYNLQKQKQKKIQINLNMEKVSFLMVLYIILFSLMISRMPFPIVWTRYFIFLQPIMICMLLIDAFIIIKYISENVSIKSRTIYRVSFSVLFVIVFCMNAKAKIPYIKDYLYQLTHQLKGPLDFLIPYIKENYKKPEDLVIATNYEELAYIYYLDCKVILGYVNKNLEEDMKLKPDLIIFRKTWGHNPEPYNQLIQRAKYKRISFPVYDSNVNNIAEMDFFIKHQFKTKLPANENEKSDILVLVNE